MKVLHLICTDIFSGAENVACQIINGFQGDDNFEMVYCSPLGKNEQSLKERNIKYLKIEKFNIKCIKKAIKDFKPDVVHAHDIKASVMAAIVCSKNVKIISHVHSNHENMRTINIKTILFNYFSKRFFKIIWVSKSSFDSYIYKNKIGEKSIILYNAIDRNEVLNKIKKDNNDYENFDIIYLGRFSYAKNPKRFIEIIHNIKAKGYDIKTAMVGSGELYEEITNLIEKLDLKGNIKLFGYVTNPYKILDNSKILVFTSIYEGTPMAALEAMALGKPIVSTPTDGLKDIIINKNNGEISNDNNELENAIIELLKNDEKLEQYAQNALLQFEKISNIDKYVFEIKNVYC